MKTPRPDRRHIFPNCSLSSRHSLKRLAWIGLFTVLALAAPGRTINASAGAGGCGLFSIGVNPDGSPAQVVLLAMGIGSKLPNDTFEPMHIADDSGYCSVHFRERSLESLERYYSNSNSPDTGSLLTELVAVHGAVILPFSYSVAILTGSTSDPNHAKYNVYQYGPYAPGAYPVEYAADTMELTIASIHKLWPQTSIMLVGHSQGGYVVQNWWSRYGRFNHQGVFGEFSLDSPISGVAGAPVCGIWPAACTLTVHIGAALAQEYRRTWANRDQVDADLVSEEDGTFVPIGTYGDPFYFWLDSPAAGIDSQLLLAGGCQTGCGLEGLDYVSPCAANPYDLVHAATEHGLVINCASVDLLLVCDMELENATECISASVNPAEPPASYVAVVRPLNFSGSPIAPISSLSLPQGRGIREQVLRS